MQKNIKQLVINRYDTVWKNNANKNVNIYSKKLIVYPDISILQAR